MTCNAMPEMILLCGVQIPDHFKPCTLYCWPILSFRLATLTSCAISSLPCCVRKHTDLDTSHNHLSNLLRSTGSAPSTCTSGPFQPKESSPGVWIRGDSALWQTRGFGTPGDWTGKGPVFFVLAFSGVLREKRLGCATDVRSTR